jgi:hypothetical protein
MKRVILIAMVMMCGGCAEKQVRILEVHPQHDAGWSTTYAHVLVEETDTQKRHFMMGLWGKTGDVFVANSRHFNE